MRQVPGSKCRLPIFQVAEVMNVKHAQQETDRVCLKEKHQDMEVAGMT